jgi:hypothetical protein
MKACGRARPSARPCRPLGRPEEAPRGVGPRSGLGDAWWEPAPRRWAACLGAGRRPETWRGASGRVRDPGTAPTTTDGDTRNAPCHRLHQRRVRHPAPGHPRQLAVCRRAGRGSEPPRTVPRFTCALRGTVSRPSPPGRTTVVACGRTTVRGPNPFPGGGWVPAGSDRRGGPRVEVITRGPAPAARPSRSRR